MRCGLRNKAAGVYSRPFGTMETIIQKKSIASQYELPGRDKSEGGDFLEFQLSLPDSAIAEQEEGTLISMAGENKRGTSQSEVPLFVWIGSPGRSRTCDQPVNSRLLYH